MLTRFRPLLPSTHVGTSDYRRPASFSTGPSRTLASQPDLRPQPEHGHLSCLEIAAYNGRTGNEAVGLE